MYIRAYLYLDRPNQAMIGQLSYHSKKIFYGLRLLITPTQVDPL